MSPLLSFFLRIMDDIFTQCREGNAVAVRLWLDNTENDLNQGWVSSTKLMITTTIYICYFKEAEGASNTVLPQLSLESAY